jgi:hypothetical protein
MLQLPPPLLLLLLLLLLAPAAPAAPGARAQQSSRLAASPSPRPETDWFSAAGRGVFTHYLGGLQNDFGRNSQGKNSTWDQCVSEFDVEAYAADAASTGARYAFITIQQQDQYMIAPNARFDALTGYNPGEACATRDLILDLWTALNKRGLKLGLCESVQCLCFDFHRPSWPSDSGTLTAAVN